MIQEFEKALGYYIEGKMPKAREIFERLWKDFRDPPSEVFFHRCETFIPEGVPEGWTGVYRATEK